MDANTITTLIGSIGFPIVMCLLLWKQMNESNAKLTEQIQSLQETVINNTAVIAELTHTLRGGGGAATGGTDDQREAQQ